MRRIGERVYLNSGGPPMEVAALSGEFCYCVWERDGDPEGEWFPSVCVTQISAREAQCFFFELDIIHYEGKWRQAQHLADREEPRLTGRRYWQKVRLLFLELGGRYRKGYEQWPTPNHSIPAAGGRM